MTLFDIPSSRLVDLGDEDLRELVARLCEAEREAQGGRRTDVTWGGSQTAPDGGLDVVVEAVGTFSPAGLLVRKKVGIQVKAGDLPPADVGKEMTKGGIVRPAISELASQRGAYLIASAGADCSEAMLQRRLEAMRQAVGDDPNGTHLHVAFLDRNALARWVSAHPSVAAWLRPKLNLPTLMGWRPYGRWSSTPNGENDDLICEGGLVFHIPGGETTRSVPDALDAIRDLVRNGNKAIRIAGLSGIGKSRIVQALFESSGARGVLPQGQAVYTDIGDSPDPIPSEMLEALIQRGVPMIMVVDNCPPETHQRLARKLSERQANPVRLITIEYDVRTDRPEETNLVRIEAEGSDIVEALLKRRRGTLSAGDASRLAELAQGNARLAFALSEALPETGTLSTFKDSELFRRLFWQRNAPDPSVERAAEVLSLVYSFNMRRYADINELGFLGAFAELSRVAMFRHAQTLCDKGLAQTRGDWRAVLPHALANRLAQQALQSISWEDIADNFSDKPRLRLSLARRLSYLHACDQARRIVNRWMEVGGPLYGADCDMELLGAVCHLAPDETLRIADGVIAAIKAAPIDLAHVDVLTRMILKIAHDEAMFAAACDRLFALWEALADKGTHHADSALGNLFGLFLSGTTAQTQTRLAVARRYLFSSNSNKNGRGMTMLRSALQTGSWTSSYFSSDDARPNPYGWEPTETQRIGWYENWLELAANVALHGPPTIVASARDTLAGEIDEIWRGYPSLRPQIIRIAQQLHASTTWSEGLVAFRRMLFAIRRQGATYPEKDLATVRDLVASMSPKDLVASVRLEMTQGSNLEEEYENYQVAENQRAERLEALGRELAGSPDVLKSIGRSLLECENRSFYSLGIGLANGGAAPSATWLILRDLHLSDASRTRQTGILTGFLQGLDIADPAAAAGIRAECRDNPTLRREYAVFLPRGALAADEVDHLVTIAAEARTAASQLGDLIWRPDREFTDQNRVRLLQAILDGGHDPELVVGALQMLGHTEKAAREAWPEDLRVLGIDAAVAFIGRNSISAKLDHDIAEALLYSLRGDDGTGANRVMSEIIARANRMLGYVHDLRETLGALAVRTPITFLNHVFPDGIEKPAIRLRDGLRSGPLQRLPAESVIEWCNQNPDRWMRIANHVSPFVGENGGDKLSQLATALVDAAPRSQDVVTAFFERLRPSSYSPGDLANIVERRLFAIEGLQCHREEEVGRTIARLAPEARDWIARTREYERRDIRKVDESFE
ncbi:MULTISPECIES: hypothetical protein [unclassified Haematobacter]|uniref:hypothetical protein n=1 Tax=unclassified Haematobacter TaxID=2640585 RepID=UPI0025BB85BC|nr:MULTISPECIES: hypothetical protein [unclassified Haematobacter]